MANPSELARIESEEPPAIIPMYQGAIEIAVEKLRKWLSEDTSRVLPENPWHLSTDCPIWQSGLNVLQASVVIERVRSGAKN